MDEYDNINNLGDLLKTDNMLDCIIQRSLNGNRYTWIGPILLYVIHYDNPDHLDDDSDNEMDSYASLLEYGSILAGLRSKPCVDNFVDRVRYRITNSIGKRNQTIIIMGEDNTDTLHNFYEINSHLFTTNSKKFTRRWEKKNLHHINLALILILSMSSAQKEQSVHKERSHRRAQFIKYFFDSGSIFGASVNAFLLEPTRVTRNTDNFMIFYQMMYGLSNEELQELRLSRDTEYTILGHSYKKHSDSHYILQYTNTIEIMDTFGIGENQRKEIFQILALLLHMGNIKFITNLNDCFIDLDNEQSKNAVKNACHLMNMKKNNFVKLFKYSSINSLKSKKKNFSAENFCLSQLYGMMTNIYELLFNWIVKKVNEYFMPIKNDKCDTWLGVLNVSGFQSGEKCNMDDFCTNYAAERIQSYFMEKYLETEWNDYNQEGLIVGPQPPTIHHSRNCVRLIENTIMPTFDDICSTSILPTSEDMKKNLYERQRTSEGFRIDNDTFNIYHYARPIKYLFSDMMCKNIGKLPNNIITTIQSNCKNELLRKLLKISKNNKVTIGDSDRCTTLSKLKNNLDKLLKELASSDLHYMRSLKLERKDDVPIDADDDTELQDQLYSQLRFSELHNVITIAQIDYLVKMTHEEYKNRYSFRKHGVDDIKYDLTQRIFGVGKIHKLHRFVGPTMIFLSEECFFKLEYYRREYELAIKKRRMISISNQRRNKWLAITYLHIERSNKNDANESSELSGSDWDNFFLNRTSIPQIKNCVSCLEMDDNDDELNE